MSSKFRYGHIYLSFGSFHRSVSGNLCDWISHFMHFNGSRPEKIRNKSDFSSLYHNNNSLDSWHYQIQTNQRFRLLNRNLTRVLSLRWTFLDLWNRNPVVQTFQRSRNERWIASRKDKPATWSNSIWTLPFFFVSSSSRFILTFSSIHHTPNACPNPPFECGKLKMRDFWEQWSFTKAFLKIRRTSEKSEVNLQEFIATEQNTDSSADIDYGQISLLN